MYPQARVGAGWQMLRASRDAARSAITLKSAQRADIAQLRTPIPKYRTKFALSIIAAKGYNPRPRKRQCRRPYRSLPSCQLWIRVAVSCGDSASLISRCKFVCIVQCCESRKIMSSVQFSFPPESYSAVYKSEGPSEASVSSSRCSERRYRSAPACVCASTRSRRRTTVRSTRFVEYD